MSELREECARFARWTAEAAVPTGAGLISSRVSGWGG